MTPTVSPVAAVEPETPRRTSNGEVGPAMVGGARRESVSPAAAESRGKSAVRATPAAAAAGRGVDPATPTARAVTPRMASNRTEGARHR